MPVYKDEQKKNWYVMTRYTDWTGERKQKCKRGFQTKREAKAWEQTFQQQSTSDMDMTMEAFVELYKKDLGPRLKENTWLTKENIIKSKILPYFGKRKISQITTKDVIAWQNQLLAYRDENRKPFSQSYLKTVHNQELICKGWFLPPNTYDCGSFVVNGKAVVGKELNSYICKHFTMKGACYEIFI